MSRPAEYVVGGPGGDVPGARPYACHACGAICYVSPALHRQADKLGVECLSCNLARIRRGERGVVTITQATRQEIEHILGRPISVAELQMVVSRAYGPNATLEIENQN